MGIVISVVVFLLIALVCGGLAGFFIGYYPLFSMIGAFVFSFVAILILIASPIDIEPTVAFEGVGQPLGTAVLTGIVAAAIAAFVERTFTKWRFPRRDTRRGR